MSRILLVDDNDLLRRALATALSRGGHELLEAENGRVALMLLEKGEWPDAVLTDLVMPEMDGFELIRELKRRRPDLGVVAMTGGGSARGAPASYLQVAVSLGADCVLEKPFRPAEALSALSSVIAAAEADSEADGGA